MYVKHKYLLLLRAAILWNKTVFYTLTVNIYICAAFLDFDS